MGATCGNVTATHGVRTTTGLRFPHRLTVPPAAVPAQSVDHQQQERGDQDEEGDEQGVGDGAVHAGTTAV